MTSLSTNSHSPHDYYDCVIPHQALGYKTPLQFLKDNGIVDYASDLSHMY